MHKSIIITYLILCFTISIAQDTLSSPDIYSADSISDTNESVSDVLQDTIDNLSADSFLEKSAADETEPEPITDTPEKAITKPEPIIDTPEKAATEPESEAVSLLDLIPAEVMEEVFTQEALEETFFNYLQELDQEESKSGGGIFGRLGSKEDINQFKFDEYDRYLAVYFPDDHSDIIQNFIINAYLIKSNWDEVTVALFKFLYLYPGSSVWDTIHQTGIDLFSSEKDYRDESELLLGLLNNINNTGEDITDRYIAFLTTIRTIDKEAINLIYVREAREFLRLFPSSNLLSSVLLELGEEELQNEKYHTGFLHYRKILTMYPRSRDLAYVLYNSGVIQAEHFNEYDAAITTFREFLLRFPTDTLAAESQLRIAQIADTQLKDWVQAVDEYQTYADTYPMNSAAVLSLMRLSEIQAKELNQKKQAINNYHYVVQLYAQSPEAIEALERCGKIYESDKKYSAAVKEYFSIYESYPDSKNALAALDKCVVLYDKRLKDKAKVKELLTIIVENYPESKSGKSAQKKLSKLK